MAVWTPFIGGSATVSSPITDQERTMNWFREMSSSPGATSPNSLLPTPGVEAFSTVVAVGGRANFSCVVGGVERNFTVYGSSLNEVDSMGVSTLRGSLAVNANPATICTNGDGGDQLFVTSGGKGYCYELSTNILTEISGLVADQGGMLYGYFVAFNREDSQIRISDLFDGQTWDPTQFAGRTIGADPWQAMLVTPYGQIFLPGSKTGEVWYNAGAFPFPFAPDPSGLFEEGSAATFSIQQAGKSVVWLATNGEGGYKVVRATGYTPDRISTHAVEFAIAGYTRIDDAIGQAYTDQGHSFYLLTFPTANVTWCFDFTTNEWHERGTWIAERSSYQYWRPVFHSFAFGMHLMADRQSGVLYRMANDLPRDVEGRVIRRLRRSPAVVNQHLRVFIGKVEILAEAGVGTITGQGSVPQFMLRQSNDGGRTWGSERTAQIGRIGQFFVRAIWWNLSMSRAKVLEVTATDPVPWRITAAYLFARGSREAA